MRSRTSETSLSDSTGAHPHFGMQVSRREVFIWFPLSETMFASAVEPLQIRVGGQSESGSRGEPTAADVRRSATDAEGR